MSTGLQLQPVEFGCGFLFAKLLICVLVTLLQNTIKTELHTFPVHAIMFVHSLVAKAASSLLEVLRSPMIQPRKLLQSRRILQTT